jgi:hypothetical protein
MGIIEKQGGGIKPLLVVACDVLSGMFEVAAERKEFLAGIMHIDTENVDRGSLATMDAGVGNEEYIVELLRDLRDEARSEEYRQSENPGEYSGKPGAFATGVACGGLIAAIASLREQNLALTLPGRQS